MSEWKDKIKRLRTARGLTQEQAADLVGYHWTTISRWERGEFAPPELMQELYVKMLRA